MDSKCRRAKGAGKQLSEPRTVDLHRNLRVLYVVCDGHHWVGCVTLASKEPWRTLFGAGNALAFRSKNTTMLREPIGSGSRLPLSVNVGPRGTRSHTKVREHLHRDPALVRLVEETLTPFGRGGTSPQIRPTDTSRIVAADDWRVEEMTAPLRKGKGVIDASKMIRDITEQAPAALAMFDTKMRYLAVSPSFLSILEFSGSPKEVIGRSHYETFPDMPLHWREFHTRVLAGEELAQAETPLPRRDGRTDWVRWSMKPWRTADGRIGGALLASELITDQVEGRQALADSEARFRVTFEDAPVGIAHVAPDGRLLRVNKAACHISGYTADELTTKTFRDITYPDDLAASVARVEQMRDGKVDRYDADKRYLRKDGTIVWGRLTASCVRKSDGSIDYIVTVIEDITARKHAEGELHKSEERFRSSVLHSPLPVLMYDDREQILAVSQSWLDKTGYSREELRCIEDWTTRAYGERSGEVLEYIRGIISTEPEAQSTELTIRTKDGRERLWSFVASALGTQSDGRRLFVAMAYDATERRAHEEQIVFLMREVSHRAKNMLSLVQAIARQTAARQPEDFIGRFTERIRALAANQDLLVRNEWQGVDVKDLVRAQLAHFADLVGSRIAVDGPKLRLTAVSAQAIGLALHELATNAGKYGALSTDAGRVDVRWRLDGDIFAISWTERNGPPVRRPERRGFGSTVIDTMAKRTVGGEVQLDYAPSGLMWRLTCPRGNALEH
jgi:PAS domain S-box-containing protein